MRLIDADELNELMTAEWFLDSLAANESPREIKKKLENAIDSVPLAYDTENVVAELEVREKTSKECYVEAMTDGIFSSASRFCGEKYAYNRAIDIVKAGGKNE